MLATTQNQLPAVLATSTGRHIICFRAVYIKCLELHSSGPIAVYSAVRSFPHFAWCSSWSSFLGRPAWSHDCLWWKKQMKQRGGGKCSQEIKPSEVGYELWDGLKVEFLGARFICINLEWVPFNAALAPVTTQKVAAYTENFRATWCFSFEHPKSL